ncbi:hypothetical protein BDR07DRAFT_1464281 [Suillus spraguei]|nr:hypothetical protein BDR07DRAFT_1464281 [Suillus spraguei]
MASAMQPQSKVPEITVLNRVAWIPLIVSSLEQINAILEKSMLTRFPYHAAQAFIKTAYNYSEPIQIRLAPLIVCADDIANKGLDALESRYPYPFQPSLRKYQATYVKLQEGHSRMSNPLQLALQRYQINIHKHLNDNVYVYSSEHLKQVQHQSVLIERTTISANSMTTIASKKINNNVSTVFRIVARKLIFEMLDIQQSTAELPQAMQTIYPEVSKTIADLRNHFSDPYIPIVKKISLVGKVVRERVSPLLEKFTHSSTHNRRHSVAMMSTASCCAVLSPFIALHAVWLLLSPDPLYYYYGDFCAVVFIVLSNSYIHYYEDFRF